MGAEDEDFVTSYEIAHFFNLASSFLIGICWRATMEALSLQPIVKL